MLLIFFQTAQNMAFSQVNASCLSPVQFFPLIRNLFQAVFRHMQHLPVKSQCFAQFGRRSAACTLMFPQQSLETKRCENIRERDSRWTKYSNPAARTILNPRTPKSQCFSARVSKSDVRGLIFFVHWG
jgi:hypothetical protein